MKKVSALKNRLSNIKIVITDVDGVLTDGGLYYTNEGLVMKKFNVKDGMGVRRLRDAGIESGLITADISEFVYKRAERLNMNFAYINIRNKEEKLKEICREKNIKPDQIAFIGDDINDLGIIKASGVSACPADAVPEIIESVDYICKKKGGEGAFREFADLILNAR